MGRVRTCVCCQRNVFDSSKDGSENDEPMDEESASKPVKKDEDDLAKYNLDDYDKESSSIGALSEHLSPSHVDSASQRPGHSVT